MTGAALRHETQLGKLSFSTFVKRNEKSPLSQPLSKLDGKRTMRNITEIYEFSTEAANLLFIFVFLIFGSIAAVSNILLGKHRADRCCFSCSSPPYLATISPISNFARPIPDPFLCLSLFYIPLPSLHSAFSHLAVSFLLRPCPFVFVPLRYHYHLWFPHSPHGIRNKAPSTKKKSVSRQRGV